MAEDDFMCKIGENFEKIKKTFKNMIKKQGYDFNEDVFMDTIIKCDNKLKGKNLKYDEIIKYLWMAFKNNTLRELNYFRNNSTDVFPENLLEEPKDNTLFYKVSRIIIDEFGVDMYKAFILHANGVTYNELDNMYDIPDIKYVFRKIREYVREKLGEVK